MNEQEAIRTLTAKVLSVSPADAETGVAGVLAYQATVGDAATAVTPTSVRLALDDVPVTPSPIISSEGGITRVEFRAPGMLAPGSRLGHRLPDAGRATRPVEHSGPP